MERTRRVPKGNLALALIAVLMVQVFAATDASARERITRIDKDKRPTRVVPIASVPSEAQQAAQDMLNEMRGGEDGWTAGARLGAANPIHLPGIAEPAYYEFKVQDGAKDAGYILVNTNQMDVLVPELSTSGPTLTELYQRALPGQQIKVVRYGWFQSAARSADAGEALLASTGFLGMPGLMTRHSSAAQKPGLAQKGQKQEEPLATKIDAFHAEFGQKIAQQKALPLFKAEGLRAFYRAPAPSQTMYKSGLRTKSGGQPRGAPKGGGGDYGNANHLRSRFDPDWRTPAWTQPWGRIDALGYDCPVGCGPTAWTIVYAYWKQFKGKDRLFRADLSGKCFDQSGEPESLMWRLSNMTGTYHGRNWVGGEQGWGYWGMTLPNDMLKGIQYARDCGYADASVVKWNSAEREKWREINREIAEDRPVMLLVNAGGSGFPDHYVIIEQTRYTNNRVGGTYGYFVNMGHGQNPRSGFPHKWIFTIKEGNNDSAFSALFVRMTDEAGPRPFRIVVDGAVGRETLPGNPSGNQNVTFHVENYPRGSEQANVQLIADGVLLQSFRLEEMASQSYSLRGRKRSFTLRASSGGESAEGIYHFDYEPPTFDRIQTSPASGGGMVLMAGGVHDDGFWNTTDYEVHVAVDGRDQTPRQGTSLTVSGLRDGSHTATMRLKDGCGRFSEVRSTTFTVGGAAATVSFSAPRTGARIQRGSDMAITVNAGGGPGIMRLTVYLDRISNDEFDSTVLHTFAGPFGEDRPAAKTCAVRANWSRGRHTLIAVATDNSGRTVQAERVITVE